jgi:E3 ubiquitin-protein ligase BRE1
MQTPAPFQCLVVLYLFAVEGINFMYFVFFFKMDATSLQYENQKLVQQLEAQKSEMHILETKFKELRNEQCSYDDTLISLNKMWNQVLSSESHVNSVLCLFSGLLCFLLINGNYS